MSNRRHILVIDLGTTRFKAAIFSADGECLASGAKSPVMDHPGSGRVELRLAVFHQTLATLIHELSAARPQSFQQIAAVSFASQANSFLLLDDGGQPLTPIISWLDARAVGIDEPLNRNASLRSVTGVPSIDHQFAISKLRWLFGHDTRVGQHAKRVAFMSDLLLLWLTGRFGTEAGLASLTGLADVTTLCWWDHAMNSISRPQLEWPRIRRAGDAMGMITTKFAAAMGLPLDVQVFMGCLDQYAGAIGVGALDSDSVCETTGTVLAAVRLANQIDLNLDAEVFQGPSFCPKHFFRMTFSSTSANMLEQYRNIHAREMSFDALAEAARVSPSHAKIQSEAGDAAGLVFRPVDLLKGPGHMTRGIFIRVAQELALLVERLGRKPAEIRSAGGGARSDCWLQLKADLLGVPVLAASTDEPTCRGAAMLAAQGLGLGTVTELAQRWCKPRRRFLPQTRGH